MDKKIVEVKKLSKVYKGNIKAVNGITFSVNQGEFFGFLGPNGAGKSTTINMISNLVKKTKGSIKIDGLEVSENADEVYSKIGFAMQEVGLDETATAREMMQLHAKLYHLPNEGIKERIDELLKLVELDKVADRYVSTYSGGMKRRFDLALSLINNPKILFLDEPTTGLDPHARRLIWNYIKDLNKKGMTIFLTTHFMEEAEYLCERLAIIDNGKIVAEGSPKGLKQKYKVKNLEGVFLKVTGHSLSNEKVNAKASDPFTKIKGGR